MVTTDINKAFAALVEDSQNSIERISFGFITIYVVSKYLL